MTDTASTRATAADTVGQNPEQDPGDARIIREEEACLRRVQTHVGERAEASEEPRTSYDTALLSLRDQIATARQEDLAPLVEEMTRLQALAQRRGQTSQGAVDMDSPYFGHLVLEEKGRQREVLIGKSTYLDTQAGIRIVDWRDAPVSRIYYRYEEGDDYEESFGDREVEGVVVTRRAVSISRSRLRRIVAPQGSFVATANGWKRLDDGAQRLRGGEGSAPRPDRRRGKLGIGEDGEADDKHLKEITPLIDPRQFELITQPGSGTVVIQGGAGSGKTTVGLHRMAFLAFHDPRRFTSDKMMVVVFNDALARYMGQLLPTLGVHGVPIRTYAEWASRLRREHARNLPDEYTEHAPTAVTRLKKHPAMLELIEEYAESLAERIESDLEAMIRKEAPEAGSGFVQYFRQSKGSPLTHRLIALETALSRKWASELSTNARVGLARILKDAKALAGELLAAWADLLTDLPRLRRKLLAAPHAFGDADLKRAHTYCTRHVTDVLDFHEERQQALRDGEEEPDAETSAKPAPKLSKQREGDDEDDADDDRSVGIDGRRTEETVSLDREDDALLLRLHQVLLGPLRKHRKSKDPVLYEHLFIDETQDLSPVELAVLLDCVTPARSVTLAGDVAQRLLLDNGFSSWPEVLRQLGLPHVEIEPLKLSYRSTRQILEFSRHVLGHLAPQDAPVATRDGQEVELFLFSHTGDAASFLAEALRDLTNEEPRASVAVIARFPEQADAYYHALKQAEIPLLRRISDQDFPFKPGIDVTDVRQVKGLEFDYVILVEVGEGVFPADEESRHLLHIAATRAAHQLWVLCSGKPSPLLPEELVNRAL